MNVSFLRLLTRTRPGGQESPRSGQDDRTDAASGMEPVWESAAKTASMVVAGLLGVVYVVRPYGLVADFSYVTVTLGAGCVAWLFAGATSRSLSWGRWIAAGLVLSGVGDVCYVIVVRTSCALPNVSIADVFYLASYVAIGAGLLRLLGLSGDMQSFDVDVLIDLGSFVVLAVVWVSVTDDVSAIFEDSSVSTLVRVVWAAYPVLDAALLAVVVKALFSRRLWTWSGVALCCGIGFWLVSDFAVLWFSEATDGSVWMDVGWMAGAALMAVAVSLKPAGTGLDTERTRPRARVLMSLAPLLVPGVIEVWSYARGTDPNPVPLLAVTVALIVLAFVRELRLVNARLVQEAALHRRENYWRSLAGNSADAVIVVDVEGRITNEAPQLVEMLGKPGAGTVGSDALELVGPLEQRRMKASLEWIRTTEGVVADSEFSSQLADGSIRWFSLRAVNPAADRDVGGVIINIHDITDRKRAEADLTRLAFHDALTGLANRSLFHDRVTHAFQLSARSGSDVALVYVDVDGFKTVNDTHGHDAGDEVLKEISARLLSAVRVGDTVARLGGDEFAILIEQCDRPLEEAGAIADRILRSFARAVEWNGQSIVLSASIGIAVGDDRSTVTTILRDADVAMYQAKTSGRARWSLFDPEMRTAAIQRQELESDLGGALDGGQFQLVYQPVVDLDSDNLVGFEALLRWHHPTRGMIGPDEFIPIAEANGSIVEIGEWVLIQACTTVAGWQHAYPHRLLSIAVNVSGRQIASDDLYAHVRDALQTSGLRPGSLVLEITETSLVQDAPSAGARLRKLRELGLKIAIDDFGTGYSSLSYLRQFPIDILKIDRSFINTITEQEHLPAIVRGLLDLAKTLHMETVAEGVEDQFQRDVLKAQHCELGQGYLFSRPLTREAAEAFVTQQPHRPTVGTTGR